MINFKILKESTICKYLTICKYYGHKTKRKKKSNYYRAHFGTLVIGFRNIYQVFRSIALLSHILITNQHDAYKYYLINSVINTFTTLLRWNFIIHVFKAKTLEDTMRTTVTFLFYKTREKIVFCKKEFVHQRNM